MLSKLQTLSQLTASPCLWQESMARHTTFKVGGPADLLVIPQTVEDAVTLITAARQQDIPITLLGNGSNLLVLDGGIEGLVVDLSALNQFSVEGTVLRAQCGASLAQLAKAALDKGLAGLAFAAGIPGTLGGAVLMNAGAYGGEMRQIVKAVDILDRQGERKVVAGEAMDFGYRHSRAMDEGWVILGASLQLEKGCPTQIAETMKDLAMRRRTKQPLQYPSAGSFFKRPEGHFAGALIEEAGMKGYRVGDAQVSELHAGFVINRGHATAAELLALKEEVVKRVKANSGITLEMEVRIVGREEG